MISCIADIPPGEKGPSCCCSVDEKKDVVPKSITGHGAPGLPSIAPGVDGIQIHVPVQTSRPLKENSSYVRWGDTGCAAGGEVPEPLIGEVSQGKVYLPLTHGEAKPAQAAKVFDIDSLLTSLLINEGVEPDPASSQVATSTTALTSEKAVGPLPNHREFQAALQKRPDDVMEPETAVSPPKCVVMHSAQVATIATAPMPEKAVGPLCSVPKHREFEAVLQKTTEQDLGLDVDFGDKVTLKLVKIRPGVVTEYNRSAPPMKRIIEGDRVLACNGLSGSVEALISAVQKGPELRLRVVRESEMEIVLEKEFASEPVGVGIDIDTSSAHVLVVKDGPVLRHNNSLNRFRESSWGPYVDFAIHPGDRILEVNGVANVADFSTVLKTEKRLSMLIQRPVDIG